MFAFVNHIVFDVVTMSGERVEGKREDNEKILFVSVAIKNKSFNGCKQAPTDTGESG